MPPTASALLGPSIWEIRHMCGAFGSRHTKVGYGCSMGLVKPLRSCRRLSRSLGEDGAAIFALMSSGLHMMVLVVESTSEDATGGIVAARDDRW